MLSALAGLILFYAVLGFLVVPAVLKARLPATLSRLLGREVTVRQVRLNPFTLAATVEGFAVKERDQLVVGSARADLEPIMELAREKMSFPGKDQHRINAPEGKLFSFRTRH